jgi:DNA-binding FrmR family transcriptional regulator
MFQCAPVDVGCRGALNGLMAEVLEGHIRFHVLDPKSVKNTLQVEAA